MLLFSLLLILIISGCKKADDKNDLVVGASSVPHSQILQHVKPELKKAGINLKIKVFDDFVLPNAALDAGELDANYYQHQPYLDKSNHDNGYHLKSVAKIHLEPIGLYSKRVKKLSELKSGAKILISSSQSDWGRLLAILEKNKLITIKSNVKIENATFKDIKKNPRQLKFSYSFDPKLMPELYKNNEADVVVINSNYAVQAHVNPKLAIATEDTDSPYSNILVVKKGHTQDSKIKKLVAALKTKQTHKWILKKWHNAILPVN